MSRHQLKRAYEKAGFKVCFSLDEANFPASVRDLDGNRVDNKDPRWAKVIEIHQNHGSK